MPQALLADILYRVARRYRLPDRLAEIPLLQESSSMTVLAIAIEQARAALERHEIPSEAARHAFTHALAQLIEQAMCGESGDPAFQAMVLRDQAAPVREYASLVAHAARDRRSIRAAVDAIAHPSKLERLASARQREALTPLSALAGSASWAELADTVRSLLARSEFADDPGLGMGLQRLNQDPALRRLQRIDVLAADALVRRYESLWDRNGPRSGTAEAVAQGSVSRRRGVAMEVLAGLALAAMARRLNEEDDKQAWRVVTSMRVPASIPASAERAKSEWDAVLLRRAVTPDASEDWDVCLLMEAKASLEAASADLPRLLRGIRLLSHADENAVYAFETEQGVISLSGVSLRALTVEPDALAQTVLYCCDAPAEATPRLLTAASRMQLLSAPASVAFGSALAEGKATDTHTLESVWDELLGSPRWSSVLHQYPMLQQVRDLMVHPDDLLATTSEPVKPGRARSSAWCP